ncbi:MAG: hypothetical protein ACRC1J_00900, partial [Sandaracinobacteroides sp.]
MEEDIMFLKDPQAAIDYQVDWTAALDTGIGLQSSQWSVEPTESGGIAVQSSAIAGAIA